MFDDSVPSVAVLVGRGAHDLREIEMGTDGFIHFVYIERVLYSKGKWRHKNCGPRWRHKGLGQDEAQRILTL